MLPTHDDALGIRMDAAANFNPATKRRYSRVNPVSLGQNSFVYRDHAENIVWQHSLDMAPGPLTGTWLIGSPKLTFDLKVLILPKIYFTIHQCQSAASHASYNKP